MANSIFADPVQLPIASKTHRYVLRPAFESEVPAINEMIHASTTQLHTILYDPKIVEKANESIYIMDTQQIKDGTAFVMQAYPKTYNVNTKRGEITAAGAWSFRTRPPPGPEREGKEKEVPPKSHPETDPATLRALYTSPNHTRLSLASILLKHCEDQARSHGYKRMEFGATFAGVAFYERNGYEEIDMRDVSGPSAVVSLYGPGEGKKVDGEERIEERKGLIRYPLGEGMSLELVKMGKDI